MQKNQRKANLFHYFLYLYGELKINHYEKTAFTATSTHVYARLV